jgi:hypothetical protein
MAIRIDPRKKVWLLTIVAAVWGVFVIGVSIALILTPPHPCP